MLSIGLFENGKIIERIDIINKKRKNKQGETLYLINKKYKIWHNRKLGARILAIKALQAVEATYFYELTKKSVAGVILQKLCSNAQKPEKGRK